jgi:hypothetical protein
LIFKTNHKKILDHGLLFNIGGPDNVLHAPLHGAVFQFISKVKPELNCHDIEKKDMRSSV